MSWVMEQFLSAMWTVSTPVLTFIANYLPTVSTDNLPFMDAIDLVMETGYQFSFVIPWNVVFLSIGFIVTWKMSIWGIQMVIFIIKVAKDVVQAVASALPL